jgi:hypothetical protein
MARSNEHIESLESHIARLLGIAAYLVLPNGEPGDPGRSIRRSAIRRSSSSQPCVTMRRSFLNDDERRMQTVVTGESRP